MHKKRLIPNCQCHCLPRPLLEPICELSLLVVLPSLVERQSGGRIVRIVRERKTTKSSGNVKASSHFISFHAAENRESNISKQVSESRYLADSSYKGGFQIALRFGVHQGQSSNRGALLYQYHHLGACHLSTNLDTKRHLQVESGRQSSCHFRLDLLRCQAYMTNGFNHCSLGIRHPARNKENTLMFRRLWT